MAEQEKKTAKKAPAKKREPAKKPAAQKKEAPKKPAMPDYVKKLPNEHIVGTEDYRKLVEDFNEKFNTTWNVNRVAPQVFMDLHKKLWKHYGGE